VPPSLAAIPFPHHGAAVCRPRISLGPESRGKRWGRTIEIGPLVGQRGWAYNPRLCCGVPGRTPDAEMSSEFAYTTEG